MNMKFAKTSAMLTLAVLAAIASPFAMADNPGWYGGVSVGRSSASIDTAGISSALLAGGLVTSSIESADNDTGYKLFAGYRFNRNFAIEGGYFELGSFGFRAATVPAGTLSGNLKAAGLNIDAVGILPITEKFSVLGRFGLTYADTRDSFSGTGLAAVRNASPAKRDTNYKFGLGLQYAFTDSLSMRADVERFRINDAVGSKGDIDLTSVGVVYRFGGTASSAPARQAP
jgi:OOP family OmpA-OmpF porin